MKLRNENELNLSPGEVELFNHYGYHWATKPDSVASGVGIFPLYRMIVETAFIRNENTIYETVLRDVIIALNLSQPYRHTPEFEKLLEPILNKE